MQYMGIDLAELYPVAEVADKAGVSRRTAEKWVSPGLRGGKVKLRTAFVGGHLRTCDVWLREFLDAMNADAEPAPPPKRRPPSKREAASHAAAAEYARA